MKKTMKKTAALLLAALLAVVSMAASVSAETESRTFGFEKSDFTALGGVPAEANVTAEEWEVLRLTNHERALNGAEPLTVFGTLQNAAGVRAEELIEVMDHQRPDGSICFSVLEEFGLEYCFTGENIAAGYPDPESVMNGWMNSSGHRKNILQPEFVHVGLGRETAENSYYGIYWVQLFFEGFGCGYSGIDFILPASMTFRAGTSIDDMGLIGVLHCKECGDCYLPISSDLCTGYDPYREGTQHVTVSCCGVSGGFDVTVSAGASLSGDVDGDGKVTAGDALTAMRCCMELTQLTPAQYAVADIGGDGDLTMGDCLGILRRAMGII